MKLKPHHLHPAFHKLVDAVLAHKPKPKSKPAKRRHRERKKIEKYSKDAE